jgi:hypothetical protein
LKMATTSGVVEDDAIAYNGSTSFSPTQAMRRGLSMIMLNSEDTPTVHPGESATVSAYASAPEGGLAVAVVLEFRNNNPKEGAGPHHTVRLSLADAAVSIALNRAFAAGDPNQINIPSAGPDEEFIEDWKTQVELPYSIHESDKNLKWVVLYKGPNRNLTPQEWAARTT